VCNATGAPFDKISASVTEVPLSRWGDADVPDSVLQIGEKSRRRVEDKS